MASVAIVILTHNEEAHLARALASVAPFAAQVFVIDSFSSDGTVEIARRHGAVVLQNRFVNYAMQFQWGLDHAGIAADWVMRLDADEIIDPALCREILDKLPGLPADVVGINLKRRHIFWNRWIRHGGRYPLVLLRLWRPGHGRIESRWMDEHMIVWGGRTVLFENYFSDHNLNDLTFFTDKHNKYATREAIDVLSQRYDLLAVDALDSHNSSLQASLKRWFKEKFYNKIPFWVAAPGYFIFRYVFQFGFLDGKAGLVYHFLQGFWYRFLVGAKVDEYDAVLRPLPDRDSRLAALSRMTGHRLDGTA